MCFHQFGKVFFHGNLLLEYLDSLSWYTWSSVGYAFTPKWFCSRENGWFNLTDFDKFESCFDALRIYCKNNYIIQLECQTMHKLLDFNTWILSPNIYLWFANESNNKNILFMYVRTVKYLETKSWMKGKKVRFWQVCVSTYNCMVYFCRNYETF